MTSRRKFIQSISAGAGLAALPWINIAEAHPSRNHMPLKPLRIGIIGAENSHTIGFGKMFNIDKKFPDVQLTHVWGETEDLARKASTGGMIPNIVKDPKEMMGKIDALIVDHRHAKFHLAAATPFIQAGIPTFIDKPFCYRVEEGKAFLNLAKEKGTAVTSFSSVAHTKASYDIKQQLESLGEFKHVVRYGPLDIDSEYGGVFFYGVHLIQPLMFIFGEDIQRVKITRQGKQGSASLVFKSGLYATLIFKNLSYGWETFVETKKGLVELKSTVTEPDPPLMDADMINMFRTGIEPRTHKSMLTEVAILEALEKSSINEEWEEVDEV